VSNRAEHLTCKKEKPPALKSKGIWEPAGSPGIKPGEKDGRKDGGKGVHEKPGGVGMKETLRKAGQLLEGGGAGPGDAPLPLGRPKKKKRPLLPHRGGVRLDNSSSQDEIETPTERSEEKGPPSCREGGKVHRIGRVNNVKPLEEGGMKGCFQWRQRRGGKN